MKNLDEIRALQGTCGHPLQQLGVARTPDRGPASATIYLECKPCGRIWRGQFDNVDVQIALDGRVRPTRVVECQVDTEGCLIPNALPRGPRETETTK
jgi:hypothetical protein